MAKNILFFSLILTTVIHSFGADTLAVDTLYTNPNYPPLVYSQSEIKFYRYTAKYIPDNLFHAFKILGTNEPDVINRFISRSEAAVINSGIYYKDARLRKEFCLAGFSEFTLYFHSKGIYYPRSMETFILLGFHQYLRQEKIDWSHNKTVALQGEHKSNRIWKKRTRKLFKRNGVKVKESRGKNRKKKSKNKQENPDAVFWGEFDGKN